MSYLTTPRNSQLGLTFEVPTVARLLQPKAEEPLPAMTYLKQLREEEARPGAFAEILKGIFTTGAAMLPGILGVKPILPPEQAVPKYTPPPPPPPTETPWYMRTTTLVAALIGGAVGLILLARRSPAPYYGRRRR